MTASATTSSPVLQPTTNPPRANRYANDMTKAGGDISDAFASMSGGFPTNLPARYAELKKTLVPTQEARIEIVKAWNEVLLHLRGLTERIRERGGAMIPQILYKDLASGKVSAESIADIRSVGTVIVKGAIPLEEALQWKSDIQEYAKLNKDRATGFPAENPQVWEFYNSKSQMRARTHPASLNSQRYLLEMWSADPASEVDFSTPLCYFDRVRIRFPGDNKFALGPHIDGGSVERWEDPTYRKCFSKLLTTSWKQHDPFDGTYRLDANMDLYKGQGACNVFRPWQGWLSMSTTREGEGTLRVYPNILLPTAYVILRPFFQEVLPRSVFTSDEDYLDASNWALDLDSTVFPGSVPGNGQELSDVLHPHLDLQRCMTSLPLVEPGDLAFWHCDVIHAVEPLHQGKGDSSVMYIPAVPLTEKNAEYLSAQREAFLVGYPPFDFSGGEGEKFFKDRATKDDVDSSPPAQRSMGFAPFETDGNDAQQELDVELLIPEHFQIFDLMQM